ncbi:hypothetical protein PO124_13515 [Bacillus licheniformis]|nr:hypothetical protein [Bacillus licheniformis]
MNDDQQRTFYTKRNRSFVAYLNEEKDALSEVVSFEGEHNGIEVDFAFQFNDGYSETSCRSSIMSERKMEEPMSPVPNGDDESIQRVCEKGGPFKRKGQNLEGTDIREGLSAIVSVRIPEELLQFEGQTKESSAQVKHGQPLMQSSLSSSPIS